MLIPILSLALTFAAPSPEPPALPKGPAPKVMVLNADKDGRPYIQASVTTTKLVTYAFTKEVDGRQVVQTGQRPVKVTEQRRIFLDDDGVTIYGPDGKKLDPKKLSRAGPAPVLVSADGKEVDPFYLPLARPETLIIVAPALAGAFPDDATPAPKPPDVIPAKP